MESKLKKKQSLENQNEAKIKQSFFLENKAIFYKESEKFSVL